MKGVSKIILSLTAVTAFSFAATAQRTENEIRKDIHNLSGIYTSYPDTLHTYTPAPKGYKPFYLSHLGRHGSRFHTNEGFYRRALKWLVKGEEEGKLTDTGKEVLEKVRIIASDAEGKYGSLTPRGAREHRHIAERMCRNYPEIFKGKGIGIDVYSSIVPRCIISMASSVERIKEFNPSISVRRTCHNQLMKEMFCVDECNSIYDELKPEINEIYKTCSDDGDFLNRMFTDCSFIPEDDRWEVLHAVYYMAAGGSDVDYLGIDLYDYLTVDECYPLWQARSAFTYMESGPSERFGKRSLSDARCMLGHFISCADEAVGNGGFRATLRYGHDQNVMPLSALMGIEGCSTACGDFYKIHEAWCDYVVTPMACNIQLIFYRKKHSDDILVKILMNEKEAAVQLESETAPYYRWADLKEYFKRRLGEYPAWTKE